MRTKYHAKHNRIADAAREPFGRHFMSAAGLPNNLNAKICRANISGLWYMDASPGMCLLFWATTTLAASELTPLDKAEICFVQNAWRGRMPACAHECASACMRANPTRTAQPNPAQPNPPPIQPSPNTTTPNTPRHDPTQGNPARPHPTQFRPTQPYPLRALEADGNSSQRHLPETS